MNGANEVMADPVDSPPLPGGAQEDIKRSEITAINIVFNLVFPPNRSSPDKKR